MPIDPVYARQRRNTKRRLHGKVIGGKRIIAVGDPIDARLNCLKLVPVQFENGMYAILGEQTEKPLVSDNPKVNRGVGLSRKMPRVAAGLGSGVVWLTTYPRKDVAYAMSKLYFNDKADRGDFYREISWREAASSHLEARERRERAA